MASDLEPRMLENICNAIDHHSETCAYPPTAIALNPDDRDELDWDDIRGLPIRAHDDVKHQRFRIICDKPVKALPELAAEKEKDKELVGAC